MRDGTPLPGRTPAQVLSQLAYRVFGPLQPTRTRIVLYYHGLLGHPAGSSAQVAARHHVTTRTIANNVAAVRAAGSRIPLSAPLIAEATRVSAPGDDHLGRARIAATLGLPTPRSPWSTTRLRWARCRPGTSPWPGPPSGCSQRSARWTCRRWSPRSPAAGGSGPGTP